MELYRKYRPKKLTEVIGHDDVVRILMKKANTRTLPHAILLSGPTGVGKTTIGRILRRHVGCHVGDFTELNCAKYRGIDQMRPLEQQAGQMPLQGKSRVWLMDECHMLTREAANCLLKILEDTPPRAYFVLATTEPQKVISTIRNRCLTLALKPLKDADIELIVGKVAQKADLTIPSEVMEEIVHNADASGRQAVVLLDKIKEMTNTKQMLAAIRGSSNSKQDVYNLCRALIFKPANWQDVAKILKGIENEDPEQVRRLMLACSRTAMLGSNKVIAKRAYLVTEAFRDNYFDSGMSGLVASCYQVFFGD